MKYNVYMEYDTESVSIRGDIFTVASKNHTGEKIVLESDQLVVTTWRVPNSDTLDLRSTGVKTDSEGFIAVDKHLETNAKGDHCTGQRYRPLPFQARSQPPGPGCVLQSDL